MTDLAIYLVIYRVIYLVIYRLIYLMNSGSLAGHALARPPSARSSK